MTVGRSTSPTHQIGQKAEENALQFLLNQGFQLIVQNYHCQFGEIDLIVFKNELLVFVEVRQRKASVFGNAASSVTASKQRKISQAAAIFLQTHPQFETFDCRFDVIAIDVAARTNKAAPEINWIEGAFEAIVTF